LSERRKNVEYVASSGPGTVSYIHTLSLGNAGKMVWPCGRCTGETEIRLDKVGMWMRLARCQRRQANENNWEATVRFEKSVLLYNKEMLSLA
jgi:hypothetical protein